MQLMLQKGTFVIFKSSGRRPRRSLERPAVGDKGEGLGPSLTFARATVTPVKSPAGAEGSGL